MLFSHLPEIGFRQHLFNIVVGVTVSGPPHVFNLWLGASRGMLPFLPFLCQLNFMELVSSSQSCGQSGHHQFVGYYQT